MKWKTAQIEAEVEDRKSARQASVDGGETGRGFSGCQFFFSSLLFGLGRLFAFLWVFADGISGELVGRAMGTVDTMAVMILSFLVRNFTFKPGQRKSALSFNSEPFA